MKTKIVKIIYCAIYPLLLFIMLERLNPASSAGLFAGFPSIRILLFSASIIFIFALVIYSISGSIFVSYITVSVILLIAYIVNYFKLAITGGVFVPSDLLLMSAAFQVAGPGVVRITARLVVGVLLVLITLVPFHFINYKAQFKNRIIALPAVSIIFVVILGGNFAVNNVFPVFGLDRGTITDRYRDNGFILGFYSDFVGPRRSPPRLFDSAFFEEIEVREMDETMPVNPNVIVIMSESFMDATILDNVTFSQYPLSNFRRLAAEGLSSSVVVPVFGGGTVNTEMEFLTGNPHVFLGSRFYVPAENMRSYFSREIPTALPWLFGNNGYRVVGVHPFYGDFFNRNDIYPLIGFHEFIAMEDMPDAPIWGDFISDEYFTDRVIEEIILAEEANEPLFLFGISMQNHWDFDPMKYGTLDLSVMAESPYLSEHETGILNSYLQGVFDADKQLGRLADFVASRDTPTIIVFFGDHMPILGQQSDRIFENLGFVSHQEDFNWTLEDRANMFQTPYLIWTNFDIDEDCWGSMSSFMLGAKVAQLSGITLNRYFAYLLQLGTNFRGMTNELYLALDGTFHYGWEFRTEDYIIMLEGLWYANMFANDAFHRSLANMME